MQTEQIQIPNVTTATEMGPISLLSVAMRAGFTLRWDGTAFVLSTPQGEECARGARFDEIGLALGAGVGAFPKKPWVMVKLSKCLLQTWHSVQDRGESLASFMRTAMAREVAARLGEVHELLH